MTPKERATMQPSQQAVAAMRLALEALEVYGEHAKDCPQYPTYTRPQDYPKCDCGFEEAITALREALAEPELNLNCKSVQKRLATVWGYVKAEQAEQEPVAWMVTMENQDGTRKTFPLSGRYKDVRDTCDFGDPIPLYARPVRTKDPCNPLQDLTDDEIVDVMNKIYGDTWTEQERELARAVIASDREKNK